MEHILLNETLYRNSRYEIKKTYNSTTDRYGLYRSDNRQLEARYLHIFPYTTDGLAAAIKNDNEYVWVNLELQEEQMLQKDSWLWQCSVPENSMCNCMPDGFADCDLCDMGSIFNSLNFRMTEETENVLTYEYDTKDNTYRILLGKQDEMHSLVFDNLWDASELEQQLRWTIDSYEQLKGEHKMYLNICVYEFMGGNIAVQLIPFAVTIKLIDTSIEMVVTQNKIILGFDEFPYS